MKKKLVSGKFLSQKWNAKSLRSNLLLFLLFLFISNKSVSQVGTLTGWGMSNCQQFNFNICPGQFITPNTYATQAWACQNNAIVPTISFLPPALPGFIVERNTWFFQSNVSGQIRGFTTLGVPILITQSFPPYSQIGPSYVGTNGVQFTPTGPIFNRNTFSISINPITVIGNSYTYCPSNGPISISPITPFNGGPWAFNWSPGGLTGNPVNVNPAVNTVYNVVLTTIPGGCISTTTVSVNVANCQTACCIGNPCKTPTPATNPLPSAWEVALNNFNYVFTGQGPGTNNRVGIGTNCNPGNKLEIDNGILNPSTSGLRLTRLPSTSLTQPNPGLGVLSVDPNGDVIYVPTGGGSPLANNGLQVSGGFVQLGGNCFNPSEIIAGQLLTDRDVSLVNPSNPTPPNQHNLWFSGVASNAANGPGGRVGIGIKNPSCMPGNRLEIFNNVTGSAISGLRLTDLSTLPAPMANPGTGVLSVDANGDVIYVNGSTAGPGNYCTAGLNSLTNNYQMDLAGFKYNFTAPPLSSSSQILMGQTSCSGGTARLNVYDDILGEGIFGYSSTSGNNTGVHGLGVDQGNLGVISVGVLGETQPFTINKGIGVSGFVGTANYGSLPLTGISIGVYGNSISNGGMWAGYFDGDVMITGNGWVNGATPIASDKRFKKNINQVENASQKLNKLNGYSYEFRRDEFKEKNFVKGEQFGFIAQEVKEVFPQLVFEGPGGYNYVNYQGMIPILVEAIKEQQKQIDEKTGINPEIQKQLDEQKKINTDLQSKIDKLEQMITACCTSGSTGAKNINNQTINLSDKNVIVLNQNVPNPFAESTVITYDIPNDFTKAQITFSAIDGKIIKLVDITAKGPGYLNVFANDLSNGLYTYTLMVDGKIISTKKMVKEN